MSYTQPAPLHSLQSIVPRPLHRAQVAIHASLISLTSVRDKGCELWSSTPVDGRFTRLVTVRDQPGEQIDREVGGAAMPCMFNLEQMLDLVKHRFQKRTSAQHDFFEQ